MPATMGSIRVLEEKGNPLSSFMGSASSSERSNNALLPPFPSFTTILPSNSSQERFLLSKRFISSVFDFANQNQSQDIGEAFFGIELVPGEAVSLLE